MNGATIFLKNLNHTNRFLGNDGPSKNQLLQCLMYYFGFIDEPNCTNCFKLTQIDFLHQVQDRFHDEDAVEWKRMRSEVKSMAKVCRNFQLKLKKAEERTGKLKAENVQLARSVSKDLRRRHTSGRPPSRNSRAASVEGQPPSDPPPSPMPGASGGAEMIKSAVIWGTVMVAGFQFLKSKMG